MTTDDFELQIAEAANGIIEANQTWLNSIACLFGEAEEANLDHDRCLVDFDFHKQRAMNAVEAMENPIPPKKGP